MGERKEMWIEWIYMRLLRFVFGIFFSTGFVCFDGVLLPSSMSATSLLIRGAVVSYLLFYVLAGMGFTIFFMV